MEKPRTVLKKFTRTISGVTPVAVMTQPTPCPGHCVYCPTYAATPQSYTPESPAVLRGRECEYDAKRQVAVRIRGLAEMGHPVDKVELIIMGGTFLATPLDYQYRFIKECYDALNGADSASLEEAKKMQRDRGIPLCGTVHRDPARLLRAGGNQPHAGVRHDAGGNWRADAGR